MSSSVITNDTMSGPSSSGVRAAAAPSTSGRVSPPQMVDDYPISSFSPWGGAASLLLSPLLSDHDDQPAGRFAFDAELTQSPGSRTTRAHTVPRSHNTQTVLPTEAAIPAHLNNQYNQQRQDVRYSVVNASASSSRIPSTATRSDAHPTRNLETEVSRYSTSHHDLNLSIYSNPAPVFSSTQDLAAHYGIPQILPPAPRPSVQHPTPRPVPQSPDFATLSKNYLTMLQQSTSDNSTTMDPVTTVSPSDLQAPAQSPAEQVAMDLAALLASPEFQNADDFSTALEQYFTSPMPTPMDDFDTPLDDSPFSDFLTTPVMQGTDADMLTSPMLDYTNMSLFGGTDVFPPTEDLQPAPKATTLDDLYTISPATPTLDSINPTSLYPSPHLPSDQSAFQAPGKRTSFPRKSGATGTRKNITVDALVPLDAPTQPRKYATPSSTSRKEVPAVFAKKRSRSQAFGDEEDELADEPLPPNATEKQQIEWKRRQNTLAARKSRQRKLLHQRDLEERVEQLTKERDTWKVRSQMLQHTLMSHNIPAPEFSD